MQHFNLLLALQKEIGIIKLNGSIPCLISSQDEGKSSGKVNLMKN